MDIISVKSYFTGANVSKISVFTNLTRYFLNNGSSLYTKKVEYDFWMSENPDFSRSKIKDTAMIVAMVKHIRNILTTLQPQIKLVADKDILLDCMQVEIAPGHTPGHIISTIYSGDEKLVAISGVLGNIGHSNAIDISSINNITSQEIIIFGNSTSVINDVFTC